MTSRFLLLATVLLASGFAAGSPVAHASPPKTAPSNGGASMPDPPSISEIRCVATAMTACPPSGVARGGQAVVVGGSLDAVRAVVFRGGSGRRDDVRVVPERKHPTQLEINVPSRTKSGKVELQTVGGDRIRSAAKVVIRRAPTAVASASGGRFFLGALKRPALTLSGTEGAYVAADVVEAHTGKAVQRIIGTITGGGAALMWDGRLLDGSFAPDGSYRLVLVPGSAATVTGGGDAFLHFANIFPIRAKHDLGQSHTNDFGGGRGHQGQDMFARCGAAVAAAQGGVVKEVGTEGAAGHFVTIDTVGGASHVYMHLRDLPSLEVGQRIATGVKFGKVGATGRASGCHLHFELWPKGRFNGEPIDPLPSLKAWDAYS